MWQFIIGIRPHNIFGYTLSAYWVEPTDKGYYSVIQNIVFQDIEANPDMFTEEQKRIVRLIEDISEKSIYRKFVRKPKISFQQFYRDLDQKIVDEFILPFIGRRMAKIFRIAYWSNIKIFHKSYRYDKVYLDDELFYVLESVEPVFYFEKTDDKLIYRLELQHRGQALKFYEQDLEVLIVEPCHFIFNGRIYHCDKFNCKKLKPFLNKKEITVTSKIDDYLRKFVRNTIRQYKVVAKGFEIQEVYPQRKAVLSLEKSLEHWGFVLTFGYDDFIFYPGQGDERIVDLKKENGIYKFKVFNRDFSWEENIVYALKHAGLRQAAAFGFFYLPCDVCEPQAHLEHTINWINKNVDLLSTLKIEIEQNTDKKYFIDKIDLDLKIDRRIDWFDVYAKVRFGDFEIPFIELKDYILQGKREFELPNGEIAIIPEEWFAKYKKLFLFGRKSKSKSNIKLSKAHFMVLESINEQQKVDHSDVQQLIEIFKNKKWRKQTIPPTIKASLRNYQKQGVAWMYTLYQNNFGGCLADDMGLGKTVQIIAAIAKAMEDHISVLNNKATGSNADGEKQVTLFNPAKKLQNLIIVPKSLIYNWVNEFKKFAPSYKVIDYAGTYRYKLHEELAQYDFIITSYGVARNDIDFLLNFEFFYVVLDESQYIKNPNSKIYKAVRQLKAQHKMLLTGTPIENSLTDLWTQMNFINPGLLGSYQFFKRYFINGIERLHKEEVKQELKQLISPFILRRTKEEVIKDLPKLTEQVVYCEMTPEQHIIYENEKSKIRNEILKIYENGHLKETSIYVLKALTRLRQIANHPAIISPETKLTSGKYEVVKQKIDTVLEENHKLLIFSSFVKHLEIYKRYLQSKGCKYAMLTGESENRKDIINRFQNNDDVKVFLISLKAGGVGLNLTAADYVFLLDPWWNPAAEQQAIARAHRIGQDKNVFVYRFITLGTVEEKIQQLQHKKSQLFKEFIDSNNIFAQLTEENIVELFE